jgi:CRP-like cAMP-binding protein
MTRAVLAKASHEAQRGPNTLPPSDIRARIGGLEFMCSCPIWRKDMNMPAPASANRILDLLSIGDCGILGKEFEDVALEPRQILETSLGPILHVYFPMSGLVSIVGTTRPNHRIEVGMVGYEGMTGLSVVLGSDRSANESVVQSSGRALRIGSASLRRAMGASPTLTSALLRYVSVFLMQASQTALANGRGKLNERLARWLLMWHDRLRSRELEVTHEFLSLLLGVRRPGVTVALHELEGQGLISSTRNHVRILDRIGLKRVSNGFYGIPEAEYDRTMKVRLAG